MSQEEEKERKSSWLGAAARVGEKAIWEDGNSTKIQMEESMKLPGVEPDSRSLHYQITV